MLLGITGPFGVIALTLVNITLIVFALLKILRNETGLTKILWILFVLGVPLLGALVYIIYFSLNKKKES